MLTAGQARRMAVKEDVLKKAEFLIESAAKQGERACNLYIPYGENYSSIDDILKQEGFKISYDNSHMIIEW